MRYIIGWLRAKPGKREEFLRRTKPAFAITKKEDGCLFYEAHPAADDPDLIVFIEGWQTAEQHRAHEKAAHHVALGPTVVELCTGGTFHEIDAAKVATATPTF
jgi:quinol monooxygenase YgiN